MHQTTASRKAIYIPHSVDVIPLEELASRLAATVKPLNESSNDAEWYEHRSLSKVLLHGFAKACEAGRLLVRDPIAHMPCHHETKGAVVLVDDAASYLAESGSRFRITRYAEALPFVGLHPEELVPLDDVPMLVANAMHDPETDSEWHGFQRLVIEKRIYEAANCGGLAMLDRLTRQRLSIRSTGACVTAGDLCALFCNLSLPSEKASHVLSRAPVLIPTSLTEHAHGHQSGTEMTPEEADVEWLLADALHEAEARRQASEQEAERARAQRSWWCLTSEYIVTVMQTHQCTTAKNLFKKLEELAGESSPFKRGEGVNRGSLVVKELAQSLSLKTLQNHWSNIKTAALAESERTP